jgi:hypothetical protein
VGTNGHQELTMLDNAQNVKVHIGIKRKNKIMKKGNITTGYMEDEKVIAKNEHIKFYITDNNYFECYVERDRFHVRVFDGSMSIKPIATNCLEIKPQKLFD